MLRFNQENRDLEIYSNDKLILKSTLSSSTITNKFFIVTNL